MDFIYMDESLNSFDDTKLRFYRMQDEELVQYAKLGSHRAAEQLMSRYRSLVENKARNYFFMGADHEDVVQEGMIGLFKAIRDFRIDRLAKFRPFAELCVTRQIITAVKTATRQKHIPLNEYVSLYRPIQNDESEGCLVEVLPDATTPNPEDYIINHKVPQAVFELVRPTLSPLEDQVLNCYLDGLSYRDMSDRLQRHTKCIDNALQRIKRKLAQTYQEYYEDNPTKARRRKRHVTKAIVQMAADA
ncbi:MAG: RNA polymerase sporulation sigma factor SigH [Fimbriimonadia bacterium]|nr:RNA polymerase sporulation sigma factor SigH [Fimbriimonadia bacterium]